MAASAERREREAPGPAAREALLHCLRAGAGDASPDETSPFRAFGPGDWQALAVEAARSGLKPLLYRYFSGPGRAAPLPESVREDLRQDSVRGAARNLQRFGELGKVLAAFAEYGLPVIVMKGAYLAEAVYRNIALRPMSDVDLLVRRCDLERADGILHGLAFRPREHDRRIAADNYEFHYHAPDTGVLVELHWDIASPRYPFAIDPGELWASARPCRIRGLETLALPPESLLLHISMHTAIHMFRFGIVTLCDIVEILARVGGAWSWDELERTARRWRVTRAAYMNLLLARRLLGAGVPEAVLDGLRPPDFTESHYETAREASLSIGAGADGGTALTPTFAEFWGQRGLRAKSRLFLGRVFPSPETIAADPAIMRSRGSHKVWLYSRWIALLLRRNAAHAGRLMLGRLRPARRASEEARLAALMSWLIAP
jgi:hypothetical protein